MPALSRLLAHAAALVASGRRRKPGNRGLGRSLGTFGHRRVLGLPYAPRPFERAPPLLRGRDILTISRCLGYSKPSVTLDTYGHLLEGADKAAAEAISRVLK